MITAASLAAGQILRSPVVPSAGYWAGAPGAFYAADEQTWYLTYRIRRPRRVAPDRGGEARIARSTDLQNWDDVWSVTKDKFSSASIERCALCKGQDGHWRYFVSYVDPADGRWCVSVLQTGQIQKLDPANVQPLFKAQKLGLEGIKDPWILETSGTFQMILSVAVRTPKTGEQSHSTLDIFNTGECVSATGLATSSDLEHWEWQGLIFVPENRSEQLVASDGGGPLTSLATRHPSHFSGWDAYCRRISSIIPHYGKYFAFYDGSASHAENYEEKTGLAVSDDLRHWKSLTPTGPLFTSPHASGSLRYMDAQAVGSEICLFFEFARPDGAHDLRMLKLNSDALTELIVGEFMLESGTHYQSSTQPPMNTNNH